MAGETFECPVCADDLSLDVRVLVGDGDDAMCRDCIIAQFEEDFERPDEEAETGFGVRWGLRRLRIGDFRELFDIDFIAKYEQRFLEFTTPREQRVYCPCLLQPIPGYDVRYCTAFVAAASDTEELVTCPQCDGTVCTLCQRPSDRDAHECTGAPEVTAGEEMDVSEMRRGKDYQRCPGCRKPYELREACNFVRCALSSCEKGFCYLCGTETAHESNHWDDGRPCTRWKHPDDVDNDDSIGQVPRENSYTEVGMDVLLGKLDRLYASVGMPRWLEEISREEWYITVQWTPGPALPRFANAFVWGFGMYAYNEAVACAEIDSMRNLRKHFDGHGRHLTAFLASIERDNEVPLVQVPEPEPARQFAPPELARTLLSRPTPPYVELGIMPILNALERSGIEFEPWSIHIRRDLTLVLRIGNKFASRDEQTAELMYWYLSENPNASVPANPRSYAHLDAILISQRGSWMTMSYRDYDEITAMVLDHDMSRDVEYQYSVVRATVFRDRLLQMQAENRLGYEAALATANDPEEEEVIRESVMLPDGLELLSNSTQILFSFIRDGQATVPFERPVIRGVFLPDIRKTNKADDPHRKKELEALLLLAAWWCYDPRWKYLSKVLIRLPRMHMLGDSAPKITLREGADVWTRPGFCDVLYPINMPAKLVLKGYGRDDSEIYEVAKPTDLSTRKEYHISRDPEIINEFPRRPGSLEVPVR
ncbi:unnamed protein product [Zymoseptoria tritici ST99CH_1E4]|uniref:RING-type domain-containing protein n=1 Tax=Zymoseptoria tritici ST99CH_1E4 TaxID=1276532 RepID=A0A2H1FNJ6_ZYMTR|nr:unnamed protein product [Zymoseptoria tritici ST99CH_1E4]